MKFLELKETGLRFGNEVRDPAQPPPGKHETP